MARLQHLNKNHLDATAKDPQLLLPAAAYPISQCSDIKGRQHGHVTIPSPHNGYGQPRRTSAKSPECS